jgi:ribosome maturation factor RimP
LPASNAQLAKVERLIEPSAQAMGYRLVQLRMMGGDARPTLQIMAERLDDRDMVVDDCAELSRAVSALLDVEDPIRGAYVLEVSSPGIDRPLTRLEDYERWAGFEARIELRRLVDNRRRYNGRLAGAENDNVLIRIESRDGETTVAVPFVEIERAKLLLTDELIEATLKKRAE